MQGDCGGVSEVVRSPEGAVTGSLNLRARLVDSRSRIVCGAVYRPHSAARQAYPVQSPRNNPLESGW